MMSDEKRVQNSSKEEKTQSRKEGKMKKEREKNKEAEEIKRGNPVTKKVKEKLPRKKNLGPSGQEWDI